MLTSSQAAQLAGKRQQPRRQDPIIVRNENMLIHRCLAAARTPPAKVGTALLNSVDPKHNYSADCDYHKCSHTCWSFLPFMTAS